MPTLTIWQGGVKVFPVENKIEAPPVTDGELKFNTCINRGEEKEIRTIRTCCSSRELGGYACNKLGYFPVTQEICKACTYYQDKRAVQV